MNPQNQVNPAASERLVTQKAKRLLQDELGFNSDNLLDLVVRMILDKRALEESVLGRDDFLFVAGHELRTPMTALKLQLQMLERTVRSASASSENGEKIASSLERSLRHLGRLEKLITDLLDAARIKAGRVVYEFQRVDITQLAKSVSAGLQPQLEKADCELSIQGPMPLFVRCDPGRMEQVFTHLLSNAMKYGAGKPIQIRIEDGGSWVRLAFVDQGTGIPVERQATLFERFDHPTAPGAVGGLGLGLFVTAQIIGGHQGQIEVQSESGKGATFKITLPAFANP